VDSDKIETKLTAARTRLILDKPFLGALVLRLPMEAAEPDWCPTTATDARKFYYNPEYIEALSLDATQFMLAHEALHCALSHFARRQHRVKHRWDLACDLAINPLLMDDGLTPPFDGLMVPEYKGMTAEEIYPLLEEDDQRETVDTHAYDKESEHPDQDEGMREERLSSSEEQGRQQTQDSDDSGGQPRSAAPAAATPPPLTPDERETLNIQWQQRLAGAAQQAMQAGKLGGALARMVDHLLQPQLPWRMLLARYLSGLARDDFSDMRPSRREGSFILPSLRSHQIDLAVALDTSGSIKQEEIDGFLAEIDAIKGQIRARVTFLPCDAALPEGAPWIFEPWEEFKYPDSISGGGGTSFRPVFEWLETRGVEPQTLVYFTDAEGEFPEREPNYPVIWLVKGKSKVPWGQRVQLN
jgi:predicted metal-dependent peptidase